MKTTPLILRLVMIATLGGTTRVLAADAGDATLLKRGEYLVERVGLCADCHSPRDERGEFVRSLHLRGSTLGFAPTVPMPVWAPTAPPIAGLPTMTVEQSVAFLQNGRRPDGSLVRPPMPGFRFEEEDARAIVAYLKSLAPKQ